MRNRFCYTLTVLWHDELQDLLLLFFPLPEGTYLYLG